MSHTRTTRSLPPETKYFPLGETAHASTSSKWPLCRLLNLSPLKNSFFWDSKSPASSQQLIKVQTYSGWASSLSSQWWCVYCLAATACTWSPVCVPWWKCDHSQSHALGHPLPTRHCRRTSPPTYKTVCSSTITQTASFCESTGHRPHPGCPSQRGSWLAEWQRSLVSPRRRSL